MGNCSTCFSSALLQQQQHIHIPQDNSLHIIDGNQNPGSVHSRRGAKGANQDSAVLHQGYVYENGAFCGVFDGHGINGHIVSKIVRNKLPSLLLDYWRSMEWQEAFVSAFKAMDNAIHLLEDVDFSLSGSSAVVVIKQEEELLIGNIGDSRAVLASLTDNGIQATQLTVDQKPGVPGEADRIRRSNGRVFAHDTEPHIQRVWLPDEDVPGLAMSRAFGDFDLKNHGVIVTPELSCRPLSSNDLFIVLASDGVWDVLSNEEVVSTVWAAESREIAAEAVVDEALAAWNRKFPRSKVDDCSVVCLFFKEESETQDN